MNEHNQREALREALAAQAHRSWSGWMDYLFSKSVGHGETVLIPVAWVQRWKRQASTPYVELSEEEKNSDRAEADSYLAIYDWFSKPNPHPPIEDRSHELHLGDGMDEEAAHDATPASVRTEEQIRADERTKVLAEVERIRVRAWEYVGDLAEAIPGDQWRYVHDRMADYISPTRTAAGRSASGTDGKRRR